jgi:hypothetical protein
MRLILTAAVLAGAATASADAPASDTFVVPGSVSPDGTWQVVIPSFASQDRKVPPRCETRVVNVRTGALLTRLPGECFFEHEGQIQFAPSWSKDSQTLLWRTDNKWGSANVQILQLKGDKVASIFDARPAAEDQVLAVVRRTSPKAYAAAKQHGKGNGAWYRDGFAIDVHPKVTTEATWPIAFTIDITSDTKCMWGAADRAGGTMAATLDAAHKWTFGPFVAGHKGCGSNGLECAFSDCD